MSNLRNDQVSVQKSLVYESEPPTLEPSTWAGITHISFLINQQYLLTSTFRAHSPMQNRDLHISGNWRPKKKGGKTSCKRVALQAITNPSNISQVGNWGGQLHLAVYEIHRPAPCAPSAPWGRLNRGWSHSTTPLQATAIHSKNWDAALMMGKLHCSITTLLLLFHPWRSPKQLTKSNKNLDCNSLLVLALAPWSELS